MNRLPPDWLEKLQTFLYFGALGAFAAAVGYLVKIAKTEGHTISVAVLVITIIAGFYLGMLFGVAMPNEWDNRDAIVLLIGATGMKGFELLTAVSKQKIKGTISRWLD